MSAPFIDPQATELDAVNHALAEFLHQDPAPLSFGAARAQTDALVVCGILGGKDVGKTTLINALAGAQVSRDEGEVSRGTSQPIAYVHEDAVVDVRARLGTAVTESAVAVATHRVDAIRNVVLVDLPDFDSDFLDHLRVVRGVAPLLDRILWIQTPRKVGDRAWVSILHDVVKDPRNVHVVLNKFDELLANEASATTQRDAPIKGDEDTQRAREFWTAQAEWFTRTVADAGCPADEDHRFLIAAAFPDNTSFVARVAHVWDDPAWSIYTADRGWVAQIAEMAQRELQRLRARVLGPVTREQGDLLKTANRTCEVREAARRIRTHFDLERLLSRLHDVADPQYREALLRDAADDEWCARVVDEIESRRAADTQLADRVLETRVQRWPLLRLVYWPFGWLARVLGRQLNRPIHAHGADGAAIGALSTAAITERIELFRSRLLADHAAIVRSLHILDDVPPAARIAHRLSAAVTTLPERLDAALRDAVHRRDRRPSFFSRAALWFLFLWFPLLQPLSAGLLEIYVQEDGWATVHGAYRIVAALSAINLLAGFAVVAAIFVLLLAGMYARALRSVRRAREVTLSEGIDASTAFDDLLAREVVEPLLRPFQERGAMVETLADRLDRAAALTTQPTPIPVFAENSR